MAMDIAGHCQSLLWWLGAGIFVACLGREEMTYEDMLLIPEEVFYVGMKVSKGGGDYADIYEVIRESAKAQLEKIRSFGIRSSPNSKGVLVFIPDKQNGQ